MAKRNQPTGAMLFELICSAALLGAVLVLASRITVAMEAHVRQTHQREVASLTLQNAMEQFAAMTPEDRVERSKTPLPVEEEVDRLFAASRLTANVTGGADQAFPTSQLVVLRFFWRPIRGGNETSLALSTFFYPPTKAEP